MKAPEKLEMFTILILRRRFEAMIREMVNALFRSGRSGVLNTAMDFSCCVTDSKLQTISTALGLPMHVGAIELIPRAVITKFGGDIRPGDCFVNNSGYHGNTHCGDFTLCAPVFVDGELLFYTVARAHLGDMGFPTPTTYSPLSRDVYEEGLILPCVRIQHEGRDVQEVVDICKANIRAPEQFYGDYLATLAAVRTGERGVQAICSQFGKETVQRFLDHYQQYAENMAKAAISALPAGRVTREQLYDSDTPLYPNGIPVRATIEVDPVAAMVTIDLRDNVDNVPLGINLTESTVLASCRNATLNVLGPDVPRCSGAFKRIKVLMREGSAIGLPRFPAATSAATTNLAQVLNPLIASLFSDLDLTKAIAFGTIGNPATCPCVSGADSRHDGRLYANQIIMGYWGGPGLYGHDGWLTYGGSGSQGVLWQSSVEVVEQQQPLLIERLEIGVDSGGPGRWEGGPGAHMIYRVRDDNVRFTSNAAGRDFPPPGISGGSPGCPTLAWKLSHNGDQILLPSSLDTTLLPGEGLEAQASGGGGCGDPLDRDPEAVADRLLEGWISPARARDIYGVNVRVEGDRSTVDLTATMALRETLRAARRVA